MQSHGYECRKRRIHSHPQRTAQQSPRSTCNISEMGASNSVSKWRRALAQQAIQNKALMRFGSRSSGFALARVSACGVLLGVGFFRVFERTTDATPGQHKTAESEASNNSVCSSKHASLASLNAHVFHTTQSLHCPQAHLYLAARLLTIQAFDPTAGHFSHVLWRSSTIACPASHRFLNRQHRKDLIGNARFDGL